MTRLDFSFVLHIFNMQSILQIENRQSIEKNNQLLFMNIIDF